MTYSYIKEDVKRTKLSSSKYSQRKKQENGCTTQNFQIACQMKGCSFVGDSETLKNHWKEKKNSTKIFGAVNNCSLKIKQKSYYVNLLEAFGQLFWFKSMISNGLLYCSVQIITNPDEAHKFFHQIEISHRTFPKKKIIVSDYCKSIRMSNFELFQEEICIILYIRNLRLFISNEEVPKLSYTLRVFKVTERPGRWRHQFSEEPNNQRNVQYSEVRTLQNETPGDIGDTISPGRWRHQFSEEPNNQTNVQYSEVRTLQNETPGYIGETISPGRWRHQFSEEPNNQRNVQYSEVRTLQNETPGDIGNRNIPVVNSTSIEQIQGQEHHDSSYCSCCSFCVPQHCIIS